MTALTRAGALAAALLACGSILTQPSQAQGTGTFLIYGNFCGPGNRGPGYPPIDALDRACARHDACSPGAASGLLPRCACNGRLTAEAGLVARDPRTPDATRDMARFIANWAASAPCD